MLGGAGFQYRFAKLWQTEAATLLRWHGEREFDYGLQLSLSRLLVGRNP